MRCAKCDMMCIYGGMVDCWSNGVLEFGFSAETRRFF